AQDDGHKSRIVHLASRCSFDLTCITSSVKFDSLLRNYPEVRRSRRRGYLKERMRIGVRRVSRFDGATVHRITTPVEESAPRESARISPLPIGIEAYCPRVAPK